jgi:hypothetical protein
MTAEMIGHGPAQYLDLFSGMPVHLQSSISGDIAELSEALRYNDTNCYDLI